MEEHVVICPITLEGEKHINEWIDDGWKVKTVVVNDTSAVFVLQRVMLDEWGDPIE